MNKSLELKNPAVDARIEQEQREKRIADELVEILRSRCLSFYDYYRIIDFFEFDAYTYCH